MKKKKNKKRATTAVNNSQLNHPDAVRAAAGGHFNLYGLDSEEDPSSSQQKLPSTPPTNRNSTNSEHVTNNNNNIMTSLPSPPSAFRDHRELSSSPSQRASQRQIMSNQQQYSNCSVDRNSFVGGVNAVDDKQKNWNSLNSNANKPKVRGMQLLHFYI